MANITYQVFKKPIEERIIDAACIYYDVEREYFSQKTEESTVVYRKSVIYYLIKENTLFSWAAIAKMFGFKAHQPVMRSVDTIRSTKNIYKQTFNDVNEIMKLANILDAELITVDRKLTIKKEEIQ